MKVSSHRSTFRIFWSFYAIIEQIWSLYSAHKQAVNKIIELAAKWDALTLMWRDCNGQLILKNLEAS